MWDLEEQDAPAGRLPSKRTITPAGGSPPKIEWGHAGSLLQQISTRREIIGFNGFFNSKVIFKITYKAKQNHSLSSLLKLEVSPYFYLILLTEVPPKRILVSGSV